MKLLPGYFLVPLLLLLAPPKLGADAAGPTPFERGAPAATQSPIDELVFQKLHTLGIQPANLCSDPVFIRRACLDVIGTLPTAAEAREFILDPAPGKRAALIDRLLERKEYADYWAMKWSDLLRVKAEFPINLWPNAAQAYHGWIRAALKENLPYDRFVREMLTASGSNFRVGQVNFYRALQNREPRGIAQAVALTFMGQRADKWPRERLDGMAGFFSLVGYKSTAEWKEEIVFFDPGKLTNSAAATAVFPDGAQVRLTPDHDPRDAFADWLVSPQNPWFARCMANRLWAWLLGRGIVQEPDDFRPDNPPSNPELLDYLERELIQSHYDMKRLLREILNSRVYQFSSIPRGSRPEGESQFASYPLRRLEAEVLIDALDQITGGTESYSSAIPEPYTFVPETERSIALEDGSISSSFLELFGKSARDTGLESERNNRPSAAQRLHLLNSTHVQRKLEQSRMIQYQMDSKKGARERATGIYLGILSRFPTEAELATVETYAKTANIKPREALVDLAWALVNSSEFLYRH